MRAEAILTSLLLFCVFAQSACDAFTSGRGGEGERCLGNGACKGALVCNPVSGICTRCGDGQLKFGEQCDGSLLGHEDCSQLGYHGGGLVCTDLCVYDLTECRDEGACGDEEVNGPEDCDGRDLGVHTCATLGYYGGQISCSEKCRYDLTDCETYGRCGDRTINGPEDCDLTELGTTCQELGYHGGVLTCDDHCAYDLTDCALHGFCGDGEVNGPEDCDGIDVLSTECRAQGFLAGQTCDERCRAVSSCLGPNGLQQVALPGDCTGAADVDLAVRGGTLLLGQGCSPGQAAVHAAPLAEGLGEFALRQRLPRDQMAFGAPAFVFGHQGVAFSADLAGDIWRWTPESGSDPIVWSGTLLRDGSASGVPAMSIDALSFDPVSGALGAVDRAATRVETHYWPDAATDHIHYMDEQNFINPILSLAVFSESPTTTLVATGMDAFGTNYLGLIVRAGVRFEGDLASVWDTYEQDRGVLAMAHHPDDYLLAVSVDAGDEGFIRLYDQNYYPYEALALTYGNSRHTQVAFTFRGHDLLAGTDDGRLLLYTEGEGSPLLDLKISLGPVQSLAVDPSGQYAATHAEGENRILVWSLSALYQLAGTADP